MARTYEIAKLLALRYLPEGILNRLKKNHYLKKVRNVSVSDEADLEIVEKLVSAGDYVVDLGANIGIYTAFLSRLVTDSGRVYSFEPIPTTFSFLRNNVTKLDLRNVAVKQAAITDCMCKIAMSVPQDEGGAENFYQASVAVDGANLQADVTFIVDGLPLDQAILPDCDRIIFIKCDVEGHELHCLRGATHVIERSRPAWLMEVSGNPGEMGSNADAVFAFMRDNGYDVWVFRQGYLEPWSLGIQSINYLFLHSEHIAKLRKKGIVIHH